MLGRAVSGSAKATAEAAEARAVAASARQIRYGRILRVIGQDGAAGEAQQRYVVRPAAESDLNAIADFEVTIAMVSFGADAVIDPAFHRRRVTAALGRPGEIMLVAGAAHDPGVPIGWAWLSARTNSVTGERYGNFRSLAVADMPERAAVGEILMEAVLHAADLAGFTHLQGKVNAANLAMRSLYRAFGFTATHITMEKRTGSECGDQP